LSDNIHVYWIHASPQQTIAYWEEGSEPSTTIENIYSELTAAAASASVASVAVAKISTSVSESGSAMMTSGKDASVSPTTRSHNGMSTGTAASSQVSKAGGSRLEVKNVKGVLGALFIGGVLVAMHQ
jgi:hypothetical protein